VLGLVIAAVIGLLGAIFAPSLLAVMGASPSVIASGANFTRVMLGGNAAIMMLFLINAVFRGAGTRRSRCACSGSRTARRLPRDHNRVLDAAAGERGAVPAGEVEDARGVAYR
jgi:hypothetical protein